MSHKLGSFLRLQDNHEVRSKGRKGTCWVPLMSAAVLIIWVMVVMHRRDRQPSACMTWCESHISPESLNQSCVHTCNEREQCFPTHSAMCDRGEIRGRRTFPPSTSPSSPHTSENVTKPHSCPVRSRGSAHKGTQLLEPLSNSLCWQISQNR